MKRARRDCPGFACLGVIRSAERETTTGEQIFVHAGRPLARVIPGVLCVVNDNPNVLRVTGERSAFEFKHDNSAHVIAENLRRHVTAIKFCQRQTLQVIR